MVEVDLNDRQTGPDPAALAPGPRCCVLAPRPPVMPSSARSVRSQSESPGDEQVRSPSDGKRYRVNGPAGAGRVALRSMDSESAASYEELTSWLGDGNGLSCWLSPERGLLRGPLHPSGHELGESCGDPVGPGRARYWDRGRWNQAHCSEERRCLSEWSGVA